MTYWEGCLVAAADKEREANAPATDALEVASAAGAAGVAFLEAMEVASDLGRRRRTRAAAAAAVLGAGLVVAARTAKRLPNRSAESSNVGHHRWRRGRRLVSRPPPGYLFGFADDSAVVDDGDDGIVGADLAAHLRSRSQRATPGAR